MKLKFCAAAVGILWTLNTLLAQEPFVCQGQYFLSLSEDVTSNSGLYLVEIDPDLGTTVFDPISNSVGATVNGMGYRSTDNFIYGVNPSTYDMQLYRLGSDGVAQALGVPLDIILFNNFYYAGDVTPDGRYLVLLGQGSFLTPQGVLAFIDLDHPLYQVTNVELTSYYPGIYDIAFDPLTGELYGFSTGNAVMVKIDPDTGEVFGNYPPQPQVGQLGALFFDVSGNLFGYGSIDGESTLVKINKETGVMQSIAFGPHSGGEDGCSCPYSVELKKTVSTITAITCTEVIYTFEIINGSGSVQTGLQLTDVLPEDFTVLEVLTNPLGGVEVVGGHVLDISQMTVPPGSHIIEVLVELGAETTGLYMNQAVLSGLPESLGDIALSDYPNTLAAQDSTPLIIETLDITFVEEEYNICPGESITINADLYGVEYLWENGSGSPVRTIAEEGNYSVTVSTGCEQTIADFIVTVELEDVFFEAQYFICEDTPQEVDVSVYGDHYLWEDGSESPNRVFTEEGNYAVTVTTDCLLTYIDYEVLTEDFYINIIPEIIDIELGDIAFLNAEYWAENAPVTFQWTDELGNSLSCTDCLSTIASSTDDATYTLLMSVENGCTYQDEVLVRVKKDREVYIPNVISPNFDGVNDYFYIQSKRNNVKVNKMSIFDRWGNLVHEVEDIEVNNESQGWDASYKGTPVQSGVFVYVVELEFLDGFVKLESGDVTVIR